MTESTNTESVAIESDQAAEGEGPVGSEAEHAEAVGFEGAQIEGVAAETGIIETVQNETVQIEAGQDGVLENAAAGMTAETATSVTRSDETETLALNLNTSSTESPTVSLAMLEALFVASGVGLSLEDLVTTTGGNEDVVSTVLQGLKERYESEDSGLEIKLIAGKYQLRTKENFAAVIRKLKTDTPRRLSAQALETLAIVAYRQPVARSEVEKLRGVDVAPTIKTLLERGLIRIVGTQPTPGSPALFGTTEEFLKVFGLGSLEELPSIRDLNEISKEPGEQAAA